MVTQSTALLPLHDAAKLFPQKNGKHPHVITIRRWILQGSRGVKLGGSRIGGQWFTSDAAVCEFIQAGTDKAMREHGGATRSAIASLEHLTAVEALKEFGLHAGRKTESSAATKAVPDQEMQRESTEAGSVPGVLSGRTSASAKRRKNVGTTGVGGTGGEAGKPEPNVAVVEGGGIQTQ